MPTSADTESFHLPEGLKARAVLGPFKGTLKTDEKWQAASGMTYGFLLVKE